jgi:prepilin-type N-terminal cleavage/methylation domain-containing protein
MKRNQSGFTLIEIAIVLVIIGLLLGGVMKGQELINSARVKNLATDFRNTPVYIYGYQDKFRALPGDDRDVLTHLANLGAQSGISAASGAAASGDGIIEGGWSVTGTEESHVFWQHIRLAGLAPGPTVYAAGTDLHPTNAVGGIIGVTNAGESPITGLRGSFIVCSNGIAGRFVKQLDISMDDGNTATGSMQATTAATPSNAPAAAIATAAINDDTTYLVCQGL